jgi:ubiquinone/menaquinone biosynthesis C-methylase UbiE
MGRLVKKKKIAFFWRELTPYIEQMPSGGNALDLGCGNGRLYTQVRSKHATYTGVDNSRELLRIARERNPEAEFVEADVLHLPFPDQSFDVIYSFAVIHHIPGKDNQKQFFREVSRVLKPNGTCLITTWHLWKSGKFFALIKYYLIETLKNNSPEFGDIVLSLGKNKALRFVHSFRVSELLNIAQKFHFHANATLLKHGKKNANIVLVATKY